MTSFSYRKDPFREDRATGDPSDAHNSNFLHPVIYFYRNRVPGKHNEPCVSY